MDHTVTISQLGGQRRLQLMIGANTFIGGKDCLSFRFRGSRRVNYIKITLDPSDTYTVEFGKVGRASYKSVSILSDVYCEDLIPIFEKTTGLYLSL